MPQRTGRYVTVKPCPTPIQSRPETDRHAGRQSAEDLTHCRSVDRRAGDPGERRRPRGKTVPGIFRRDNPQQKYPHAYCRACCRFFGWCEEHRVGDLENIEQLHVAAYIGTMQRGFEKPSVKQHLAAIRMLLDWMVTGQIVATNPAHAVRGRHADRNADEPD